MDSCKTRNSAQPLRQDMRKAQLYRAVQAALPTAARTGETSSGRWPPQVGGPGPGGHILDITRPPTPRPGEPRRAGSTDVCACRDGEGVGRAHAGAGRVPWPNGSPQAAGPAAGLCGAAGFGDTGTVTTRAAAKARAPRAVAARPWVATSSRPHAADACSSTAADAHAAGGSSRCAAEGLIRATRGGFGRFPPPEGLTEPSFRYIIY